MRHPSFATLASSRQSTTVFTLALAAMLRSASSPMPG
jgi:hypothetical protein